MAIVIPAESSLVLLAQAFSVWTPWYHLFVDDVIPDQDTTLPDFTEPSGPWYEIQQAWHWSDPVRFMAVAVTYSDPLVWTAGAITYAEQVYGYYVTLGRDGPLAWCERRSAGPVDMSVEGAQVEVVPRFTFRQDPSPE